MKSGRHSGGRYSGWHFGALLAVVLAAGLVVPASAGPVPTEQRVPDRSLVAEAPDADLVAFDSCESALRAFKRTALKRVGPYGLPGAGHGGWDRRFAADGTASASEAQASPGHSTTNTHERGVDEPDLVKTDGRRLVTVADGVLRVVDVRAMAQTAAIEIPGGAASSVFLHGDRALVMTHGQGIDTTHDGPVSHGVSTRLVLVDVTGAGAVLGSLTVDGAYVDARMNGSIARLVLRSEPQLDFTYPSTHGGEAAAAKRNEGIVAGSSLGDWLPRFVLERDGQRSTGQLTDCASISHPKPAPGPSLLTVLTFDLAGQLGKGDPVSITADGAGAVYGTSESLYIATAGPPEVSPFDGTTPNRVVDQRTRVYQFGIAGAARPRYLASGSVKGGLLNQYSMSEYDGHLRIATTVDDCCDQRAPRSESIVSVLARHGTKLAVVGQVGGLGKGERIYSVRFIDEIGYVVTFRRTDPLYRLDLSDPRRPRVTGELKITGYSAYLHPIDGDRLLGVGQEATDQGAVTGAQVSLFDVGDPGGPRRVAQHQVAHAQSEIEFDPHAFLYWPARELLVVPIRFWSHSAGTASKALVLRLVGDSFVEVGSLAHPANGHDEFTPGILRSVVIADKLWTVSDGGLMASDIGTLTRRAWLPFG